MKTVRRNLIDAPGENILPLSDGQHHFSHSCENKGSIIITPEMILPINGLCMIALNTHRFRDEPSCFLSFQNFFHTSLFAFYSQMSKDFHIFIIYCNFYE